MRTEIISVTGLGKTDEGELDDTAVSPLKKSQHTDGMMDQVEPMVQRQLDMDAVEKDAVEEGVESVPPPPPNYVSPIKMKKLGKHAKAGSVMGGDGNNKAKSSAGSQEECRPEQ